MNTPRIIFITLIFSTLIVYGKQKNETVVFKYLSGEKKISYDSGKNWNSKKNLRIRFKYIDFTKYSLDGGKNWFYEMQQLHNYNTPQKKYH